MVRALHAAHIEVILDVVYNHTAEGDHLGPTLAFRGIDNPSYYRLVDGQPRFYSDSTGTGNSLNVRNPHVLQLMMDSLRYWVLEMHVDGFRFDLAASLARQFHEVDRLSAFFDIIQQDPVISQVKLIAEPWDLGDGGYQVGQLPAAVVGVERQVPRHRPRLLAPERGAHRRPGRAPDRQLRPLRGHRPPALRQHQLRHLPRRLHPRRPGLLQRQAQRGQRGGRSGRHRRQPVLELRRRRADRRPGHPGPAPAAGAQLPGHPVPQPGRARCCSAATSSGAPRAATTTPTARTRRCPGTTGPHVDQDLLAWTERLIALRRAHPVFRRRRFFQGHPLRGSRAGPTSCPTSAGSAPTAAEMTDADWEVGYAKSLGVFLNGHGHPGSRRPRPARSSTTRST